MSLQITEPDPGRRIPIRFSINVVLPTPLRPMTHVTWPSSNRHRDVAQGLHGAIGERQIAYF